MSDMAVNTTGIKNIDSIQTGELCKESMVFSKEVIKKQGFFISKIFMCIFYRLTFAKVCGEILYTKLTKQKSNFKPQRSLFHSFSS